MATDNPINRDTQFMGFAKALYEELTQNVILTNRGLSQIEAFKKDQELLIARRAYDLVEHTLNYTTESMARMFTDEAIEAIPDMTELQRGTEHDSQ
jgi:hypothetical protein